MDCMYPTSLAKGCCVIQEGDDGSTVYVLEGKAGLDQGKKAGGKFGKTYRMGHQLGVWELSQWLQTETEKIQNISGNVQKLQTNTTKMPLFRSSDHNQGIHSNVSAVCTQRGWSKSPNRARNYAPSGRERCSESWPSCTTARAQHPSQVNKQTHSGSLERNEGSASASRSTCEEVRRKGSFVAG